MENPEILQLLKEKVNSLIMNLKKMPEDSLIRQYTEYLINKNKVD